jgi:rhodanese-related sulfurtransferase
VKHGYAVIGPSDAFARLERYVVVDVREPPEFTGELGRVPGSRLVPLGELLARVERGELLAALYGDAPAAGATGEGRPVLLVCRSGNRSGKACAQLAAAGFAGATNLLGGMLEWNRLGLPVETGEGGEPGSAAERR